MSLTSKQRELLEYVDSYIKESNGVSPSYNEMRDALKLASKSGINRLMNALVERGFIRRIPHRARALEVVRSPGAPAPGRSEDPADRYRTALLEIATGEGVYGAQAHEYKLIARKALGMAS